MNKKRAFRKFFQQSLELSQNISDELNAEGYDRWSCYAKYNCNKCYRNGYETIVPVNGSPYKVPCNCVIRNKKGLLCTTKNRPAYGTIKNGIKTLFYTKSDLEQEVPKLGIFHGEW